jgi:hypothetical protein
MERVVARDGDVAYARREMVDAMKKVTGVTQLSHAATTGSALSRRNP